MTSRLLLFALLASSSLAAQQPARPDTAARRKAMEKLSFLVGDWGGEAVAFTGPGQQLRMWQTEWVRYKLNGQVLAIEGLGRRIGTSGPSDTAFNAWAVMDWTPERGYLMRSNTLDGRYGEFAVQVSDSGFVWGMQFPGGQVRYTMQLTPAGEWHEKGEFTRDGTRWFPTMEMRLKRTAPTSPRLP